MGGGVPLQGPEQSPVGDMYSISAAWRGPTPVGPPLAPARQSAEHPPQMLRSGERPGPSFCNEDFFPTEDRPFRTAPWGRRSSTDCLRFTPNRRRLHANQRRLMAELLFTDFH